MCRYNHFCANVVKGLGAFWDNIHECVVITISVQMLLRDLGLFGIIFLNMWSSIHCLLCTHTSVQWSTVIITSIQDRTWDYSSINFIYFLIKKRSEKYFYFAELMNYKFYALLCGNNALKQKTVHSFMVFYVHVLLYNAAKYFCV
jgi:hypothetical protein